MKTNNLRVTQSKLRYNTDAMNSIRLFVKNGGDFINIEKKIILIQTEDDLFWIRDGLHRICSIFLERKSQELFPEEYKIETYTYKQVNSFNFSKKFYTPIDLHSEVRRYDLTFFRTFINAASNYFNEDDLMKLINKISYLYKSDRQPHHSTIETFTKEVFYEN